MAERKQKTRAEIASAKAKIKRKKIQKKVSTAKTNRKPTTVAKKKTPTTVAKKKTPTAKKKTPTAKKNLPAVRKSTALTTKKPSTATRLARVAGKTLKSPVGKFGIPAAVATAAYFGLKEFGGKKPKKKTTPKKVKVIEKNKPTGGGSIGRTSMKDFKPKTKTKTLTAKKKASNKRFDPRKANRAGQKFGQR